MKRKGYSGIDVDFEYLGRDNANQYTKFIKKLRQKLCAEGFFVFVDLPPKTSENQKGELYEGQIYKDIGCVANSVMLMTYEWGYTYSPPMPVAPIDKVREVAEFAVEEIPREKVTLGIPNYGYIWHLPYENETSRAQNISNSQAVEIAFENKANIKYNEAAATPYFTFYDKVGNNLRENISYFEDARSIKAKLELAHELGLKGVGFWNIMNLFIPNWTILNSMFNILKGYNTESLCDGLDCDQAYEELVDTDDFYDIETEIKGEY
jgi:spore germination protein